MYFIHFYFILYLHFIYFLLQHNVARMLRINPSLTDLNSYVPKLLLINK